VPQPPAPRAEQPRERKASGNVARVTRAPARAAGSGTRPAAGRGGAQAAQAGTRASAKQVPAAAPARAGATPSPPSKSVFEIDLLPGPALPVARSQQFPVPAPAAASAAEPKLPQAPRPQKPAAPVEPAKPREPRSRSFALLVLLCSGVIVYLGLALGDSVLQGNASPLSVLGHGLALYGFGFGISGLRP
jgi:hypothetical protein